MLDRLVSILHQGGIVTIENDWGCVRAQLDVQLAGGKPYRLVMTYRPEYPIMALAPLNRFAPPRLQNDENWEYLRFDIWARYLFACSLRDGYRYLISVPEGGGVRLIRREPIGRPRQDVFLCADSLCSAPWQAFNPFTKPAYWRDPFMPVPDLSTTIS